MANEAFTAAFHSLKALFEPYAEDLVLVHDTDTNYYLNCPKNPHRDDKAHYFGSVTIRKNYVSFYLMPIYTHPGLASSISPELNKRKQGKSCFNFKTERPELFQELAGLVKAGYETYEGGGYIK